MIKGCLFVYIFIPSFWHKLILYTFHPVFYTPAFFLSNCMILGKLYVLFNVRIRYFFFFFVIFCRFNLFFRLCFYFLYIFFFFFFLLSIETTRTQGMLSIQIMTSTILIYTENKKKLQIFLWG